MLQLYLRHEFYNKIFKIKRKLYTASVSAIPSEIFWVDSWYIAIHRHISL